VSGNHADVAIFDAATIKDRATYDTPTEPLAAWQRSS
jgi:N-acyl-D-amino-acid deacylase